LLPHFGVPRCFSADSGVKNSYVFSRFEVLLVAGPVFLRFDQVRCSFVPLLFLWCRLLVFRWDELAVREGATRLSYLSWSILYSRLLGFRSLFSVSSVFVSSSSGVEDPLYVSVVLFFLAGLPLFSPLVDFRKTRHLEAFFLFSAACSIRVF